MNLASFLVGLVGPLMARWLASVGLSLVVLTGLTSAASALKSQISSDLSGLPLVALQLGGLLGLWEAIGIWLGAITFVITWQSTKGFWTLAKS
ncbi:MAG: DUF2523 domain-containing protein [Proteobacteria bacterium]|nr:DUF2523 domain-containing protein [Pseudomonadota bacterium]